MAREQHAPARFRAPQIALLVIGALYLVWDGSPAAVEFEQISKTARSRRSPAPATDDPTVHRRRVSSVAAGYYRGANGIVEVAAWWLVGLLVWAATVSPVTAEELVPAALCALACASAARAARRAVGARWRVRARWSAWAIRLPIAVVADAARLARRWWGRPWAEGVVRRVTLEAASDPALVAAHRAAAAAVLSAAPGSVVLDVDGDDVVLHALTPGPSRLEEAVRR